MPALSGFDHVPTTKSNSTRSIAAHPCKKGGGTGHFQWEWCTQRSLKVGHPPVSVSVIGGRSP
jgi:hypothetical protein